MEQLHGGRENAIYRLGDKVSRPSGKWSETVQKLLLHIANEGFTSAPKPFGFDNNGNEILSYVEGEVFNYPLKGNIATVEALVSASQLLRQYHDASRSFISENLTWMLPCREPMEVICHGDYAPYNVALVGSKVVGVIDFDTAHPAPRNWDIAYALYCWAPFKTDKYDAMGDLHSQSIRAKQFCDAYGLSKAERISLVTDMCHRIQALVEHIHNEASKGNEAFIANIKNGHHLAYLADIEYLQNNSHHIADVLMCDECL